MNIAYPFNVEKVNIVFVKKNVYLDKYTHFEIAFIYEGALSDGHDELLEGFNRKEELQEYKEGTIYPYVPNDLIEDLYKYLKCR